MNRHIIILCMPMACEGPDGTVDGNTGTELSDTCTVERELVSASDDSLGFTAADVTQLLTQAAPTQIAWSDSPNGEATASIQLNMAEGAGDIYVVTGAPEIGGCRTDAALRVPLDVEISIADGLAVASGTLTVDAVGLSADAVYPFSDLEALPLTLSGDYADQLDAYVAEGDHAGDTVEAVSLYGVGSWTDTRVSIEADYTEVGVEVVWRGNWAVTSE